MWSYDNKVFNVNGQTKEDLLATLYLALRNSGVAGWQIIPSKGFVLYTYIAQSDKNKFPVPINYSTVAEMVWQWLQTPEAKKVPMDGWDKNADHDGENELGFRVYTEDWGHIEGDDAIAIKPAYIWYGK